MNYYNESYRDYYTHPFLHSQLTQDQYWADRMVFARWRALKSAILEWIIISSLREQVHMMPVAVVADGAKSFCGPCCNRGFARITGFLVVGTQK